MIATAIDATVATASGATRLGRHRRLRDRGFASTRDAWRGTAVFQPVVQAEFAVLPEFDHDGTSRNPDQCGGRGTGPMMPGGELATRLSGTAAVEHRRDWSEAQAPIWLPRARVAK